MKRIHKWLLVGLVLVAALPVALLLVGYPLFPSNDWDPVPGLRNVTTDAKADQADFRKVYPFHIQTIALSKRDDSGHRTLIISEPPPSITLDQIKAVSPQYLGEASVVKNHIGHDGWTEDVVVDLAAPGGAVNKILADLNRLMFQTDYKAYVLPLPAVKPLAERYDLNIHATTAELRQWLIKDDQKFTGLTRNDELDYLGIASQPQSDVFYSKQRGLVAWWIPAAVPVQSCAAQARQFALDSDLIVGAIGRDTGTCIFGRERQVPVDVLPPLRFETIALLGSVNSDELAQSYERRHPFAGRLDSTYDWAPALLSPELRDTEYGSLLNIADQFLKGWLSAGVTKYENFEYPDPTQGFPFGGQPLMEYLGVNEVTYNWNTTGAGYSITDDNTTVYALDRTGALPISYIPGEVATERNQQTVQAEAEAYTWYSKLNNPYLVRVVQYAAMYQIFRRFPTAPPPSPPAKNTAPEVAFSKLSGDLIDKVTKSTPDERRDWAKRLPLGRPAESYATSEEAEFQLDLLAKWIAKMPGDELDVLKRWIGDSRGIQTEIASSAPSSQNENVDPSIEKLAENLHRVTNGLEVFAPFLHDLAITERIPSQYVTTISNSSSGWIHTPVIVVSSTPSRPNWEGGHNLRASVTKFEVDPTVPEGHAIVTENGMIKVNPSDSDMASAVLHKAARAAQDNRDNPEAAPDAVKTAVETSLKEAKSEPPRPMEAALGGSGGKEPPPGGERGFPIASDPEFGGPRSIFPPPAGRPSEDPAKSITVHRHDDNRCRIEMHGYTVQPNREQAYSFEDTSDYIAHALASHLDTSQLLQIEMNGFTQQEADALAAHVKSRFGEDPEEVRGVMRDSSITPEAMSAALLAKCDYSRMSVNMVAGPENPVVMPDGTQTIILEMNAPRKQDPNNTIQTRTKLSFAKMSTGVTLKTVSDRFRQMIGDNVKGEITPLDANQIVRKKYNELRKAFPNDIQGINQQIRLQSIDNNFTTRILPIEHRA